MSQTEPYPWQQQAWAQYVRGARANRLSHALLLTAPPGTGLLHFARCLCADFLGLPTVTETLEDQPHIDLYWLRKEVPTDHNKLTKPRMQIVIEQVRGLANYLMQKPTGACKVAVIEAVHHCSESAANALLKPLEEPARQTYILLVSEMPGQIPATIRSRCTQLKVGAPSAEAAAEWLGDVDPKVAGWALWMTGHAPVAAQAMIEEGTITILMELDTMLAEWLQSQRRDAAVLSQLAQQEALLVNQLLLRSLLAAGLEQEVLGAQIVPLLRRLPREVQATLLEDCISKRRLVQQLPVLNHTLLLTNQLQHWLESGLATRA